jgi:hypothetical protein
MPSETVRRSHFVSVCEERDRLRDLLRHEQRRHAWLQQQVTEHQHTNGGEGSAADRRLWSAVYAPKAVPDAL